MVSNRPCSRERPHLLASCEARSRVLSPLEDFRESGIGILAIILADPPGGMMMMPRSGKGERCILALFYVQRLEGVFVYINSEVDELT